MAAKVLPVKCDRWKGGVCAALTVPTTCPRERAENLGPGACCHHPLRPTRERLEEMKAAGVKLERWAGKLSDPAFVEKLHAAFVRRRKP